MSFSNCHPADCIDEQVTKMALMPYIVANTFPCKILFTLKINST